MEWRLSDTTHMFFLTQPTLGTLNVYLLPVWGCEAGHHTTWEGQGGQDLYSEALARSHALTGTTRQCSGEGQEISRVVKVCLLLVFKIYRLRKARKDMF